MKRIIVIILLFVSSTIFTQVPPDKCGDHRWSQKTLTDSLAADVNIKHPVFTTVYEQTLLPGHEIKTKTPRLEDEKTVYKVMYWFSGKWNFQNLI